MASRPADDGAGAPRRKARSRGGALPRVAVVGLGIGRSHVVGLLQPPARAEVCALCDPNRSRLRRVGEEFGVAARYADFEEMLEKEKPDAVVVATPNDLHAPVAVAALEAGAHVLCEKPLAHRLDAAREIAEAARKRRRFVMLDLSFRFTGGARTAKRFLESGRCGDLYHSSTYWARTRGIPTWAQWFFTAARSGGGPVIDLGVHRIDLALWFLGEPAVERVAAFAHGRLGRRLVGAKYDVEEFGGGILRCAGGASVVFETSWAENSGRREVMLTRTLGVRGGAVHNPTTPTSSSPSSTRTARGSSGRREALRPADAGPGARVRARHARRRAGAGGAARRGDRRRALRDPRGHLSLGP
jgi:predicted dehydrogenase